MYECCTEVFGELVHAQASTQICNPSGDFTLRCIERIAVGPKECGTGEVGSPLISFNEDVAGESPVGAIPTYFRPQVPRIVMAA